MFYTDFDVLIRVSAEVLCLKNVSLCRWESFCRRFGRLCEIVWPVTVTEDRKKMQDSSEQMGNKIPNKGSCPPLSVGDAKVRERCLLSAFSG